MRALSRQGGSGWFEWGPDRLKEKRPCGMGDPSEALSPASGHPLRNPQPVFSARCVVASLTGDGTGLGTGELNSPVRGKDNDANHDKDEAACLVLNPSSPVRANPKTTRRDGCAPRLGWDDPSERTCLALVVLVSFGDLATPALLDGDSGAE